MELIKAKGKFFLPENKSIKISGILTFSHQEGAILELLGTFTTIPGYHQIILGLTSEGTTLWPAGLRIKAMKSLTWPLGLPLVY